MATTPAAAAFVTFAEACTRLGIKRSTGYEMERRGDFPVPVTRHGRSSALKVAVAALDAYVAEAAGDSSGGGPSPAGRSPADAARIAAAVNAMKAAAVALAAAAAVLEQTAA